MRFGMTLAGLGAVACVAHAGDRVFDNLTQQVGVFQSITNFDPTLALIDDLQLVGGGELDTLTFTYGFVGGGAIMMDLGIALLLDDGDGVFEPRDDGPLFGAQLVKLTAESGVIHEFTLDLPEGIFVPSDATIWFGTTYATSDAGFVNMGQGLYNDFTVGASDEFVYIFDFATNDLQTFPQDQGEGVGAVLTVVPAPASLLVLAMLYFAPRRRRN